MPEALYLTEDDVDALADMRLAIDAVEEAFRRLASGDATNVPRMRAQAPECVLHTMSAAAPYLGLVGWKSYVTSRHGARFHVGLYSASTGEPVAWIEADRLGQLRTGATTGVAASWMALPAAGEMGLFGTGRQAQTQLAALVAVRPIKRAFIYSRSEERRARFASRMSAQLGIDTVAVDRPIEAAEELPVVVTATNSAEPVFDGNALDEGTFVAAVGSNWIGRAEIDANVLRRADNIVCDSVEACKGEAGDFVDALQKGIFDWSRAVNLADVATGKGVGRSTSESISLFKSVGLAIEDVALAAKVVERAKATGRGRTITLP